MWTGEELCLAPDAELPLTKPASAHLLSIFDEAFLSDRRVGFPRSVAHPARENAYRFAEVGGGAVINDLQDVGRWKRIVRGGVATVSLDLDSSLGGAELAAVEASQALLEAVFRPVERAVTPS